VGAMGWGFNRFHFDRLRVNTGISKGNVGLRRRGMDLGNGFYLDL